MRITPDKEVKHGLHTDYYWPGVVHSVWRVGKWLEIRRERTYRTPANDKIRSVFLKVQTPKTEFGIRR